MLILESLNLILFYSRIKNKRVRKKHISILLCFARNSRGRLSNAKHFEQIIHTIIRKPLAHLTVSVRFSSKQTGVL